jgi:magnesium-transporting ATPase (P-type)
VLGGWSRCGVLPFDHDRLMVSVLLRNASGELTQVTKGAPEAVLRCGHASLSSTQIYIRAAGHHVRDAAHALPVRGVLRGIREDTTSR